MISYSPLWETMKTKNITTYDLREKMGISSSTISRLRKNLPVTTNTLDYFCELLDCKIEDVCIHISKENNN